MTFEIRVNEIWSLVNEYSNIGILIKPLTEFHYPLLRSLLTELSVKDVQWMYNC